LGALALLDLKSAETAKEPREAAMSATKKLVDQAFRIIDSETDGFFVKIQWPETATSEPPDHK
jgi:hypothetical protein